MGEMTYRTESGVRMEMSWSPGKEEQGYTGDEYDIEIMCMSSHY